MLQCIKTPIKHAPALPLGSLKCCPGIHSLGKISAKDGSSLAIPSFVPIPGTLCALLLSEFLIYFGSKKEEANCYKASVIIHEGVIIDM